MRPAHGRARRPPRGARLLLRLRRLGDRHDDVAADLDELFVARASANGHQAAARAYWRDVFSFYTRRAPRPAAAAPSTRFFEVRSMWRDVVFALRLLRREQLLTGITLGSVMLAVGLTTALYGILGKLAWPDSGVRDPETLSAVRFSAESRNNQMWTYADFLDLEPARSIAIVASIPSSDRLTATRDDTVSRPLTFDVVSGRYFEHVGGGATLGRLLAADDDKPGAPAVVVLSRSVWRNAFGGDPDIVGRSLWLRDQPVTVVGVAASGFLGPNRPVPPAFWTTFSTYNARAHGSRDAERAGIREQLSALEHDRSPVAASRRQAFQEMLARLDQPRRIPVGIFGRLGDANARSAAEAELTSLARTARIARGEATAAARVDVELSSLANASDSAEITMLAVMVLGAVLLIACVNIANVLIASAVRRRREISTRLALGAGRWRVVRQLFTESLVLGVLGGVAGLLIASWIMPLVGRALGLPTQIEFALDRHAYFFAAMSTGFAVIGAGLVPSLYGRRGDLFGGSKVGADSGHTRLPARRLRALFVGVQAAASIVLLVAAALFTRALLHVATVDIGFQPDTLMTVHVSFGRDYDTVRRLLYWEAAITRVPEIPGVRSAAVAAYGPMSSSSSASEPIAQPVGESGTDRLGGSLARVHRNGTTAGYFETIGLPVLRGRTYTDEEVRNRAPVAVISASLARAGWGESNPIGSSLERIWGQDDAPGAPRMGLTSKPAGTRVIGVVADAVTKYSRPQSAIVYLPFDETIHGPMLVSAANPSAVAPAVQDALLSLNPAASPRVSFTADTMRDELLFPRALATVSSLLGLTALVLAVVGLFGITAFVVDLRRHEVSVRLALGATGRTITRMLMRDCLRPVVVGVVAGLVLAPVVANLIRVVLFGIAPYDPWAIGGAALLMAVAAAAAVLFPARRASRVDPVQVLKAE